MNFRILLEKNISFQENSWSSISKTLSIQERLSLIKNGEFSSQIKRLLDYLRLGQNDLYDLEKSKLPAVTFSANFNKKRNRESL